MDNSSSEICETFFSPDRWPRIASVSLESTTDTRSPKARYGLSHQPDQKKTTKLN